MTLLTQAKETKLNAATCQLFLQYELYFKYVDRNKATITEEEIEKLRLDGEAEIKQLKSSKGAKKNITKLFASFHAALSSKNIRGKGKGPRAKRAPKKPAKDQGVESKTKASADKSVPKG